MFAYFMSRDRLIRKIDALVEADSIWNPRAQRLMNVLAHRDGVRFNGHWYYGALKDGTSTRSGLSAAIHDGGVEAGAAYLRIMDKNRPC